MSRPAKNRKRARRVRGLRARVAPPNEAALDAIRAARWRGLFLLIESPDGRGPRWVFYDREGGGQLLTYRPRSGRWSTSTGGGVADDWRDVLELAAAAALRWGGGR